MKITAEKFDEENQANTYIAPCIRREMSGLAFYADGDPEYFWLTRHPEEQEHLKKRLAS
jgi:hypothetical protein